MYSYITSFSTTQADVERISEGIMCTFLPGDLGKLVSEIKTIIITVTVLLGIFEIDMIIFIAYFFFFYNDFKPATKLSVLLIEGSLVQ